MITIIKKLLKKTVLSFLFCAINIKATQALPFSQISQIYFFGDSLTDSGFNNLITIEAGIPNKAPTFTTYGGYTWAQYLARDIKGYPLPIAPSPTYDPLTNNTTPLSLSSNGAVNPVLTGIDYACGGSLTASNQAAPITWAPSLVQQINHFLVNSPAQLDPHAIYFIWSGANDLLRLLDQSPSPNQSELRQTAERATINIANQIAMLTNRGAKRIVVMAIPDLGAAPFAKEIATQTNNPSLPASLKNLTLLFNNLLSRRIEEIISQRNKGIEVLSLDQHSQVIKEWGEDIGVLYFNTYSYVNEIFAFARAGLPYTINGQPFYFANISDPVCDRNLTSLFCTAVSNNYFFADGVHPTDLAHRALSLAVENSISAWL